MNHADWGFTKTVRVKASHPSQGDFVVINEADYNEKVHGEILPEPPPPETLDAAIANAVGGEPKEPAKEPAKK